MAKSNVRSIVDRQLAARAKLWPEISDEMLYNWKDKKGFVPIPRLMPLLMSIMDDLSGKGMPVGQTYLEMWTRLYDELFLTLNRPEEMAFHAGFSGQRALRTWKDRVRRLIELGFVNAKSGPLGDLSYVILPNPFHVIKRAHNAGLIQEAKWQALVIRANEIGAFDLDDVDDEGKLIVEDEDEEEVPQKAPRTRVKKRRRAAI